MEDAAAREAGQTRAAAWVVASGCPTEQDLRRTAWCSSPDRIGGRAHATATTAHASNASHATVRHAGELDVSRASGEACASSGGGAHRDGSRRAACTISDHVWRRLVRVHFYHRLRRYVRLGRRLTHVVATASTSRAVHDCSDQPATDRKQRGKRREEALPAAPSARHVRCVLYGWLGKIRKKAAKRCAAMRARRDWRQVSESQSVHARATREERRGPRALKQKSLSQDSAGGAGYLVEL